MLSYVSDAETLGPSALRLGPKLPQFLGAATGKCKLTGPLLGRLAIWQFKDSKPAGNP